jgi:uncharacterized protein (TIGR00251 family)
VLGWLDESSVRIAIAAPAKEGKANAELINFIAGKLSVPKGQITIKRGHNSPIKHLSLPDILKLSTVLI